LKNIILINKKIKETLASNFEADFVGSSSNRRKPMKFLSFNTATPLDHVPRVLDILRTMSFELDELNVESNGSHSFCIQVTCIGAATKNADTLKHRVGKLQGIEKFHFV